MGTDCHFRYQNSRKVSILPGTQLPFQRSVLVTCCVPPTLPRCLRVSWASKTTHDVHIGAPGCLPSLSFHFLKHILMENHKVQLATSCRAGTDTCQFPCAASQLPSHNRALALMLPSPPNNKWKIRLKTSAKHDCKLSPNIFYHAVAIRCFHTSLKFISKGKGHSAAFPPQSQVPSFMFLTARFQRAKGTVDKHTAPEIIAWFLGYQNCTASALT